MKPVNLRPLLRNAVDWFFLAWVALIPVMNPFRVHIYGHLWLQVADVCFAISVVLLIAVARNLHWNIQWNKWATVAALFLATLLLSAVASEDRRESLIKFPADAYVVGGAILASVCLSDTEKLRKTILAWLVGTALTAAATAAGLALYFAGFQTPRNNIFLANFGTLPPGHYPRLHALFWDHNMYGSYMIASAMVAVAAWEARWISRTVYRVLFWSCIAGSLLSITSGLAGLTLSVTLWYSRRGRTSGGKASGLGRAAAWAGYASSAAFLIFAAISLSPFSRVGLWETLARAEPSGRALVWAGSWRTFAEHPLFGKGLGLSETDVRYLAPSGKVVHITVAHNTWLSIMAQAGLPAAILFSALVFMLLRRFRWRFPDCEPTRAALELALLGGILYPCLSVSFENTRHFWLLLGIVAAVQNREGGVRRDSPAVAEPTV